MCFVFPTSVSAVQAGDATILGVKGQIWNLYGDNKYYDATVNNQTDCITFAYQISGTTGNPIATYSYLSFSGYDYGTLKLSYDADFGSIYPDSFNGLYNENNEKISDFGISNDTYTLEYTGTIPKRFSVRAYFTAPGGDPIQAYTVLNITFTPSYDNITDNITQNQDENTQEIIDNQNQLQENEKNEASSSGNSNVDDVIGAIPTDNEGLINALTNFAGAMMYNGTECAWTFPEVKFPKVAGITTDITLIEEQPINFKPMIDAVIPDNIMKLIKAISTVGLIIYCCKELYGWIEYIATLRKGKSGGSDE